MNKAFNDFLKGKITIEELLKIGEKYDKEYENLRNWRDKMKENIIGIEMKEGTILKTFYDSNTQEYVSRLTDDEKKEGRGDTIFSSIINLDLEYNK